MTYEQVKMAAFADELTKLAINKAFQLKYLAQKAKKTPPVRVPGQKKGGNAAGSRALLGVY
jgi:hypothetical protein